jgi:hypothetical protein
MLPGDQHRPGESAQSAGKLLFLPLEKLGGNCLSEEGRKRAQRVRRANTPRVLRETLSEEEIRRADASARHSIEGRKQPDERAGALPSPHAEFIRVGNPVHGDALDRPVKTLASPRGE